MSETDIASIIRVIDSIENIMKIAEKNPQAFNIESLKRSREMALSKLDEAKQNYRNAMSGSPARLQGEQVTLKAYKN